jgi:hypothetical protein
LHGAAKRFECVGRSLAWQRLIVTQNALSDLLCWSAAGGEQFLAREPRERSSHPHNKTACLFVGVGLGCRRVAKSAPAAGPRGEFRETAGMLATRQAFREHVHAISRAVSPS